MPRACAYRAVTVKGYIEDVPLSDGTVDVTLEDSWDVGEFKDGGMTIATITQQLAANAPQELAATTTTFGPAVRAKLVVGTAAMTVEVWVAYD